MNRNVRLGHWSPVSLSFLIVLATLSVKVHAGTPIVLAGRVTEISTASARFNGTVFPNGLDARAWFEISTSSDFNPNVFFYRQYPSTNLSATITYSVTFLATNQVPFGTFFSRLVASNSAGTTFGSTQLFTTKFDRVINTPDAIDGATLWGDYNNDGRLDFL